MSIDQDEPSRVTETKASLDAVIGHELVEAGWFNIMRLQLRLNDRIERRLLIEHVSGAAVLPYDPVRRVALVTRQTRDAPLWLAQPAMLEPVAGVTEGDEPPQATAEREALEEVGVRLGELEHVGRVWMTPSSTTERVHLFLASYGDNDRIGRGGGASGENEQIDVIEYPLAALWRSTIDADIVDAKLMLLLQALRLRHPDLF